MSLSAPIYWPATLPLPLMSPPRSLRPRPETHRMETKRIRVRRYYPDYLTVHDFQWKFTSDQFEAFKAYYETDLTNGEDPFVIVMLDPLDSSQLATYEFGFFEAGYEFNYTDGVYTVSAVVVLETVVVEQLAEADPIDLCAVILWPAVSDGIGGGTTFDCFTAGDYTGTVMTARGTNVLAFLHGGGLYGFYGGEDFESFPVGGLFSGTPSSGSLLIQMYYGNSDFGYVGGLDFDDEAVGAYIDGEQAEATEILFTFSGDP